MIKIVSSNFKIVYMKIYLFIYFIDDFRVLPFWGLICSGNEENQECAPQFEFVYWSWNLHNNFPIFMVGETWIYIFHENVNKTITFKMHHKRETAVDVEGCPD